MTPWTLCHDTGTGDFFNAECFWSPERKAALELVHHSNLDGSGSGSMIQAMRACPDLAHVEHRQLQYPTERPEGSIPTMRDHAISHRMAYRGSSFLAHRLVGTSWFNPGRRFAYVQPDTPKNGPGCTRWITPGEWPFVLARLDEWNAVGVVVNAPGGKSKVPDDRRLIDLTGQTTMPESIEVLKQSIGYIGVDSCFAILAAQLFQPDRLMVRCNNPYLVDNPWWTYPPLQDGSFLYPSFHLPAHRQTAPRPSPGVIVELRCNALVVGRTYGGGSRVEVDPPRAARMIEAGQATPVDATNLDS